MIVDMQALLTPVVDCRHWKGNFVPVAEPLLRTILAEQRTFLGLTQADIGREIGLKRGMVSVLEREPSELIQRGPEFTLKFFKAYKFSEAQAKERTRKLFSDVLEQLDIKPRPNPLDNFTISEKFITYPVYTSASAGTGEPEIIEGEVAAIPEGALRARGVGEHNRHEVMPVKVNGNCLVSQNVRFSDKNVSHGDYVFVHLKAPPNKGDRVCCFDHSDNQLIIKFLGEAQDPNQPDLITFFDARGLQYVRKTSDIEYVGVVFWRSGGL